MDNNFLVKTKIHWKRIPLSKGYFYADYEKRRLILRLNNFPDEPIYTLINGLEITDIEEKPIQWSFER